MIAASTQKAMFKCWHGQCLRIQNCKDNKSRWQQFRKASRMTETIDSLHVYAGDRFSHTCSTAKQIADEIAGHIKRKHTAKVDEYEGSRMEDVEAVLAKCLRKTEECATPACPKLATRKRSEIPQGDS